MKLKLKKTVATLHEEQKTCIVVHKELFLQFYNHRRGERIGEIRE